MSRPRRPRLRFSLSELSAIALQFLQHEARHDQLGVDHPRIANIGNPTVDNHTRVQDQRLSPLDLLGKLDVGDDKAKFVLGLQQRRNDDVTADQRDEQLERVGPPRHGP